MRPAYIYILLDPRTGEIRYVGKSCDVKRRYWDHIGSKYKNHTGNWVRSLKELGLRPIMEVIEDFDDHDERWEEAERFYITYFQFLGFKLTNQESGGVSGKLMSEEARLKMSASAKGRQFSELAIQRSKEARQTHEFSEKMAAAKRGIKRSQESIEKHRAKMIGHATSEETRRKLSEANKGKKPSALAIQRTKETAAFRTYSPETRAKLATFKGRQHTEEAKRKIGEKARARAEAKRAALMSCEI